MNKKVKLGQNFLIDRNISKKIISVSELSKDDILLEIGPGLGAITEDLAKKVKKVYAVEIDYRLCSYLKKRLMKYNNVEIINKDVLDTKIPFHNKVVSNIPYTITGPILEKIFFKEKSPMGILTIEKSIADRIFLTQKYKDLSRISIGVNTFMTPILKSDISNISFYPAPKIAISLIKIAPKESIDPFLLKEKSKNYYLKFIAGIMPYKNKNIVNALHFFFKTLRKNPQFTKKEILTILHQNTYKNKKVFNFKIEEFVELSKLFYS